MRNEKATRPAVGQVWQSADKRDAKRDTRFRLVEVSEDDGGFATVENVVGKARRRRIRLSAFLGTNRYSFVEEA